ncbi:FAD/FMN-containing dehydrogenase [Actinoplanes lutulentus]|uniref:FAD/FMN-containing dehydrogenase n=1 Tax=Actinoplanes lutulentus TaxID=1287878 RepID=A0A327YV08_9ACTN|nr:FAD-binding oxidoreductase [Actinoplanes lutulentus]MBB2940557.1 FAD/FMN-containing dehydrogenase [Actinoplanes lutulentus]RAK24827.1 FAD/FMN-containing dehydrogenase [Actinoplanes lutulentus]
MSAPETPGVQYAIGITALQATVAGPVLLPGDASFAAEIATYNLTVVHTPAVVVGATSVADVQEAVRFAAVYNLPVAVLGAGHGSSVSSDGAVLITTRRLTGLSIDETAKTARVEAGVRWGEFVEQASKLGLAGLNGSSPTVTVVGYTLGGGLGPFGRKYGYAADHVTALDVVTANGELRHVTADSDPDLFWALRGAKGNFGVVVAIEFTVFPLQAFYGGGIFFPGELAGDVLHLFREWTQNVPEEMSASVGLLHLPAAPFVPEPLRDRVVVHLRIAYLGGPSDGALLVEPFRKLGTPIIDAVGPMPYAAVATIHNDPVDPLPVYEHAALLRELPAEAVDTLLRFAGPGSDSPLILAEVRHMGGALARTPEVPNAVGNRDQTLYSVFLVAAGGPPDAEALHAYEQQVIDALEPWSTGRRYLNFMFANDADPQTAALAYAPEAYERLTAIKRRFDPSNLFRINHNIPPAS